MATGREYIDFAEAQEIAINTNEYDGGSNNRPAIEFIAKKAAQRLEKRSKIVPGM